MRKIIFCIICIFLIFSLSVNPVLAASEVGSTAKTEEGSTNLGNGDTDKDGVLRAADARNLARAFSGYGENLSPETGDFNMDNKVDMADARILLRAAANIAPLLKLDANDALAMNGLGLYDNILHANGSSFSLAEYHYYYESFYMSYAQQSYYYDQYYGSGYGAMLTGFDYTKPLSGQNMTTEDGSVIPYSQYFHDMTISAMEQYSYYVARARELELTLTDEEKEYIANAIEQIQTNAQSYGMTADDFLQEQYGEGVNLYIFEKVANEQVLAQKYQDYITDDFKAKVTEDEIEKIYNENPNDYDTATARVFRLTITTDDEAHTTNAQAQQVAASEFVKKVKDEASFVAAAAEADPVNFSKDENSLLTDIDFATMKRYVGEDAAAWLFSKERKPNDIQIFSTTQYVYVVFVVEKAARNDELLPSARHILISFADEEEMTGDEKGLTNANGEKLLSKEEAYQKAEKILAEFRKTDKSDASFASLAEKYSEDTASLSTAENGSSGGLYEDIPRGAFVKPFEDWVYDESRKEGDTGIVESEYGYHIMYFQGRSEEPAWKENIRTKIATERTEDFMNDLSEKYVSSAVFDEETMKLALQDALAVIDTLNS